MVLGQITLLRSFERHSAVQHASRARASLASEESTLQRNREALQMSREAAEDAAAVAAAQIRREQAS